MLGHSPLLIPLLLVSAASVAFALTPEARSEEQRLSGPYTHDNLAIFLVHGKSAEGPVPLTLDEALAKGKIKVHETGTVSELTIENDGDEEVFVHAGDIVKGGKQDRVVTSSLIMKGKSGQVPLTVFCVERGRWSARGGEDVQQFASAKEMMPSREAKLAMRAVPVPEAAAPEIAEQAQDLASGGSAAALNLDQRANHIYRHSGHVDANARPSPQAEVWRSVSNIQSALSGNLGETVAASESETSLQLALENEKLAAAQKAFVDALASAGEKDGDVVGYVFAVNGRINSGDIYASNALFKKLWPKLLKAAATEAIGAAKSLPKAIDPTAAAVDLFLAEAAAGKKSEMPSIDGQRLETREADATLDYVTARGSGEVVHRNVLARH
jgi:hypothetical protein